MSAAPISHIRLSDKTSRLGAMLAAIVIFFPRGLAGIATDAGNRLVRRKRPQVAA